MQGSIKHRTILLGALALAAGTAVLLSSRLHRTGGAVSRTQVEVSSSVQGPKAGRLASAPVRTLADHESRATAERQAPPPCAATVRAPGPVDVEGLVVDAVSGEPVPSFRVHILPEGSTDAWSADLRDVLREDPEGRFTLENVAAGRYAVAVDGAASGLGRRVLHDVEVPSDGPVVVRVGRGAHVEGHAVDGLGRALAGIAIALHRAPEASSAVGSAVATATTDVAGCFLFTRLAEGRYWLDAPGAEALDGLTFEVGVDSRVEQRVVIRGSDRLCVEARDDAGRPIVGADVLLMGRSTTRTLATGEDGLAWFGALAPGRYALRVRTAGAQVVYADADIGVGDAVLPIRFD